MTFCRVLRRFCSKNAGFSVEELEAISYLKQKAQQQLAKSAESFTKSRDWACAPIVEVSGKMPLASWQKHTKKGQRFVDDDVVTQPIVRIRWHQMEHRDVDILLETDNETHYSTSVKSVLYGMIQAISCGDPKIRLRTPQETVVKVANGKYKASKEVARFQLIAKVLNASEAKKTANQMKAKLEHIPETTKLIRRVAAVTMTELEFFEKYRNSIEKLKNYE